MKTDPNGLIWSALVYCTVITILFLTPVVAQRPHSDFNQSADIASAEQAFAAKGLNICAKEELNWSITPGFISGKVYDLNTNCSNFDPNYPGARAWLAKFNDIESRDAALRNFETTRRHIGLGIAWSKGPLIMLVDGNQKPGIIGALKEVASSIELR
jgi:hypothetical protein